MIVRRMINLTQATISRLERRPNMLLDSLANYVEGLGGRLEICAVLPDRTVKLRHLLATVKQRKSGHPSKGRHRETEKAAAAAR